MAEPAANARPEPRLDGLAAEFYAYCATGTLRFQRCEACGAWRHLPREMCPSCASSKWTWEASSGRGRIFSWTVTHRAPHPAFAADVPYAVVVVELEEGVRMVSGLRGLAPEALELDLAVEVGFESVSAEFSLPYFKPSVEGEPAS